MTRANDIDHVKIVVADEEGEMGVEED
jgi:hypothetical protein